MNGKSRFRDDELVTRKIKVNGEWQKRIFPVVGGRLRLAHEENESLSLATEMVQWDGQYAVFRCTAETQKGRFIGYGTANAQRDTRLSESLIELAETRSIARALRFAGYGVEFAGLEEVAHVPDQTESKEPNARVFDGNGGGKNRIKTATLRQWSGHTSSVPSSFRTDPQGQVHRRRRAESPRPDECNCL